MPNAISLTLRTFTADAAAARSLERTASMRCPRLPRRMAATSRHSPTVTASATQPNTGLGSPPSRPRNAERGPRSRPNRCGSGTGEPVLPPPQVLLTKPNWSIATAAPSVTTARLTPRTRSAEAAVSSPSSTAAAAPHNGASGKPMPASTAMCETTKPETPARASCTTEICPTKPVMTTSDRAITVPISELISACLKSNGRTTSATAQTTVNTTAGRASRRGRGTSGSRCSTSSPRPGSLAPRRNIAATMNRNAISSFDAGQRHALVGREPRLGREVVDQRVDDPDAETRRAGDPERREAREQGGRQRRHDLERQRGGVELGDGRRQHPDPAGDARSRGACWPATARSPRARRASPTPRSRTRLAWPGRSGVSGRPPSTRWPPAPRSRAG